MFLNKGWTKNSIHRHRLVVKFRTVDRRSGQPGVSTAYKRWSKFSTEKVREGSFFAAFFQELRGS